MAMTSSTSSNPLAGQSHRVRLPPRSELPPEVTLERLPLVGTSWYERGVNYWARRIGIGVVLAVVVVVYVAAIEAVLQDISSPGSALYYGLAAAEVVFTLVTGVWVFRRMWRNTLRGKGINQKQATRAGRAGASVGTLAFSMGGVLAGLIVFSSLLTAGLFLAAFVTWILPMPPAERYARSRIAERLRIRHGLDELSPRSKHYGSKNHHQRR